MLKRASFMQGLWKLAIFGGSFRPLHQGHVALVRLLLERGVVDSVGVLPCRQSPFKQEEILENIPAHWKRVKEGFVSLEGVFLLDTELFRSPPSFSVESLSTLQSAYPKAELFWAMGMDVVMDLRNWYRAEEILERVKVLVVERAGFPKLALEDLVACLPESLQEKASLCSPYLALPNRPHQLCLVEASLPKVSSTEIREKQKLFR